MAKVNMVARRELSDLNNLHIGIAELIGSVFCNVKDLLIGEDPIDVNELELGRQRLFSRTTRFPVDEVFSARFSEILKELVVP